MSTPIEIVKEFQLWRRGQGKYAGDVEPPDAEMPYSPAQYGEAIDALIETAERYQALQDAGYLDITVLAAKPAMNNFAGRRKGQTKHVHAHSLNGLADQLKGPQ